MGITWTDEWVLRDSLIYKVRTYSNGAVSEDYVGAEESTQDEGVDLVFYQWNWETNDYDEVGREPNPNPPQQQSLNEFALESKVDWLMAELAAVKAAAESDKTALQLALAETIEQQLIDQTATQVGLAELAQAQADDTDTLQLAVAEVATLVTGGDM